MSSLAVHWYEGMALRPHHFQAADRHWRDQLRWSSQWDRPYHWGVQDIRIDPEALKAGTFKLQRLNARLSDGTIIRIPDDGVPADRNLRDALTRSDLVEVSIGVPVLQPGRPNLADGTDEVRRYHIEAHKDGVDDENTSDRKARPFLFRRLTLKLLVGDEDPAGYETLPLARVQPSGERGAVPRLDPTYIPPLLACDAWLPLRDNILLSITSRISALVEEYGKRVRGKIRIGTSNPQALLTFEKFRILNEVQTYFGVLVQASGIHPFEMYVEFCRLLGRLAVLGEDMPVFEPRRPGPTDIGSGWVGGGVTMTRQVPLYDHNDLGTCFTRVRQYIEELLTRDIQSEYEQESFSGLGLALKAPFKQAWLANGWQMFIGVQSSIPSAECAKYLTGQLNMKIAAYARVEEVFRFGRRGLEFKYVNNQPPALPSGTDMTYFQINRDSSKDEWIHVQNNLDVSIRLNENLILDSLQDKTEFLLKFGGNPVKMTFTLYIVPPGSQSV